MSREEALCTRILIKVLQGINMEELPKLSSMLVIFKKTWELSSPLGIVFMS